MAERQDLDDTKWIDKHFLSVDQEELKPILRRPNGDNNPLAGELQDLLKDIEIKIKCYDGEKVYGSEYAMNELKSVCGRIQKMLLKV